MEVMNVKLEEEAKKRGIDPMKLEELINEQRLFEWSVETLEALSKK